VLLYWTYVRQIVNNAEAQYLAFFAAKTIEMIRAPDEFVRKLTFGVYDADVLQVYPAPFNLIEIFLVAPLE
jgi:hypothetical protein